MFITYHFEQKDHQPAKGIEREETSTNDESLNAELLRKVILLKKMISSMAQELDETKVILKMERKSKQALQAKVAEIDEGKSLQIHTGLLL